jgi:hypothetical protein
VSRLALTASLLIAAALLAACGQPAGPATVTVTKTVDGGTTEAGPATKPEATTGGGETGAEAPPSPRIVHSLTLFSSPTKNIGCAIDTSYARCDLTDRDWEPPAKPADCDLEWGDSVEVSKQGKAAFVCHGDTTRGSPDVLEYGDALRVGAGGQVICWSETVGMSCENQATGHGFFLARESYRTY